MIAIVIDNLVYEQRGDQMFVAPVSALLQEALEKELVWIPVPPVAVRTPRQEAMLAHIKAAIETAETSQL